jgi:MFS family permease
MKLQSLRTPAMVLACGSIILCISFGARAGMGLYLQPMALEYGWGRGVFSLAMAIQNLAWGAMGPFAGAIADRYGPARVVAIGGLLYALGLATMAYVTSPLAMHITSGILVGGALACTSFAVVFAVIQRVSPPEKRSAALGIATAAGSFGQFALLPVTQLLISYFDWHIALIGVAAISALIVPLSISFAGRGSGPAVVGSQSIAAALRESWKERGFHLLFWGYFVCGFHIAMFTVHLPAFVIDQGMGPQHGMTALALIGLFNIVGSLGAGWLGGRFSKKYLLSIIYTVRAGLIAILVFLPVTPITLYVFACGIGLLWLGTVPLTNGLVGQIFGMRYAAMLASIVFFGHQLGSFTGVWLAGYLYDTTGSYLGAFSVSIGLGVLAALINLPVNETPLAQRKPAPAAA